MSSELPKCTKLEPNLTKKLLAKFKGERTGFVRVGEKKYFYPYRYMEQAEGFYKFKARASDTWVMSHPRSGTTWTQELVWLLSNELDYESARTRYLAKRFPLLEYSMLNHPELTEELVRMNEGDCEKQKICRDIAKPGYQIVEAMDSPRFIKTHFPLSLLPGILDSGCKIVYVARNPKDVAVSWYHFNRACLNMGFTGDFPEFWEYFRNNLTCWSPYWEHLKEAWSQRNHPNRLFIFYEEMQQNFHKTINKVANFLGKNYNADEIAKLADYLDIKNFRNNPMVNLSNFEFSEIMKPGVFVRNGKSGTWKESFTEELEASADAWIKENLRDTDLRFPNIDDL